jgi:regulator of sigma E protease
MTSLLAFLLLIGSLVFIHELGHLVAARLVGVKVLRFSIGYGPPLARMQVGETEYVLAPIPLGGYVQLLGQSPYDEIPASEQDRALTGKPYWAKVFVTAAGPVANFILPLLIFFAFFIGTTEQLPPVIGTVMDDSAAASADLEPGDRFVAIDGRDIRSWSDMQAVVSRAPERELRITVERDGERFDRYVTPRKVFLPNVIGTREPRGQLGVLPSFYAPQIGIIDPNSPAYAEGLRTGDIITSLNGEPLQTVDDLERLAAVKSDSLIRLTYLRPVAMPGPFGTYLYYDSYHAQILPRKETSFSTGLLPANTFVRAVKPGSSAAKAGLLPGDRVLAIGDRPISRWETLDQALQRAPDATLTLQVQSLGEAPRTIELTQDKVTIRDVYKNQREVHFLGAEPFASRRMPDPEPIRGRFTFAATAAWSKLTELLWMQWLALQQMLTLQRGTEDLSSVVGMYNYAGIAAEQGPSDFLLLMALISLSLGFANLLPIPVLDGGHLLFYTVEAVRRRPMSQRAREIASAIGLVAIFMLLLVALRNDIVRFWGG